MVQRIYETLMSMEVDSKLNAGKSERTEGRSGYRSQAQQASTARVSARWGYRERRWDTQLGTMNLKVPKVREGGYIPFFLEPNKRIDDAVVQLVQEAYIKGVSTRKIDAVVKALGIEGISAGQVSARLPGSTTIGGCRKTTITYNIFRKFERRKKRHDAQASARIEMEINL